MQVARVIASGFQMIETLHHHHLPLRIYWLAHSVENNDSSKCVPAPLLSARPASQTY